MFWRCDFCGKENLSEITVCHQCHAWKCPSCGIHNKDSAPVCLGCSYSEICPLVLESKDTGKTETLRAPLEITQAWLRSFGGEDAQFASSPQFKLSRNGENQWLLETVRRAKNPTFINGKEALDGNTPLNHEDMISIGSRKGNPDRLKIRVVLEMMPPVAEALPPIIGPAPTT